MVSNKKPKVSVIMPFYNCEKYLDKAISSILNQTFQDFEFIIINDASSDRSDEIIQKSLTDKRIVYIKNRERKGIVYNLNKGIEIAKADIIARMDGDDISEPQRLEVQYQFLQRNPNIALVGCFVKLINEKGEICGRKIKPIKHEEIKKDILVYATLIHATIMIRKDVFKKVGFYREQYLWCEDIDLWYRIIFSGYEVANIPQYLYQYRRTDSSVVFKYAKQVALIDFRLRKETIEKFKLKLSLKEWFFIYLHLFLGLILTGRQKEKLQNLYKKLFYGE
ncbi:glycosyltransferase family A protein [Thermococcus sp.]|uniref:glycosyltransferase family 2 protein n=1 Tax=Thermococcus sp. TaxID=35749 RepID=UPI00260F7727|nr:glycosyltransferase family A protein [Thermococcus sp.]MCD6144373.1 glycosyltransferase family 2 protein [Thermococcus sp.]